MSWNEQEITSSSGGVRVGVPTWQTPTVLTSEHISGLEERSGANAFSVHSTVGKSSYGIL